MGGSTRAHLPPSQSHPPRHHEHPSSTAIVSTAGSSFVHLGISFDFKNSLNYFSLIYVYTS